eukprot:UC4_evm1s955
MVGAVVGSAEVGVDVGFSVGDRVVGAVVGVIVGFDEGATVVQSESLLAIPSQDFVQATQAGLPSIPISERHLLFVCRSAR